MSVHTDIAGVLAGVAGGRVYWEFAPEQAAFPFVVIRRTLNEPQNTLQGYGGITHSVFVFDCWAVNKLAALDLAATVAAAIDAAATDSPATLTAYREGPPGEDFEPDIMELMEPVQYSIWHP